MPKWFYSVMYWLSQGLTALNFGLTLFCLFTPFYEMAWLFAICAGLSAVGIYGNGKILNMYEELEKDSKDR